MPVKHQNQQIAHSPILRGLQLFVFRNRRIWARCFRYPVPARTPEGTRQASESSGGNPDPEMVSQGKKTVAPAEALKRYCLAAGVVTPVHRHITFHP